MSDKNIKKNQNNALMILRSSIFTLFEHKPILFPYCIIVFIQFFLLEIFYFAPRYPLNLFFGPVIAKLWSEEYIHYPYNLYIVPKLFQYSQAPIYIFISSSFIAASIMVISAVNNGKRIQMKKILKETFKSYIHIVAAALLAYLSIMGFFHMYGLLVERAILIRSESGMYFMVKKIIMEGAPYFNLLLSVFVTTLFAYVLPVIMVENEKVFQAVGKNFKYLFRSFFVTFFIVFIPTLLFIPVLLLRNSIEIGQFFPEATILGLVLSIIVMVGIDAVVYTALTTNYLLIKESK